MAPSRVERRKKDAHPQGSVVKPQKGEVKRAWLSVSERISRGLNNLPHCLAVRDVQGKWAGALYSDEQLHTLAEDPPQLDKPPPSHPEPHFPCELVAISRGYVDEVYNTPGMAEWMHDERPEAGGKGSKYEWYNVLWIEWEEEIAYRKGVGRIHKAAWEAQELEWIDVVLG